MDISREKSVFPMLGFFPITNQDQDFYFMIANKFLGAVGLVKMHLIEHECNLGTFVFCFRYILSWNIIFQETRFPNRSYVARIPISILLKI